MYSQHPTHWPEQEASAAVELRADAPDNIWICEMGDEQHYSSFERFVEQICLAHVQCNGLRASDSSPSLGEVSFGWTEPLCVSGQEIQLHGYRRFDNPYCQGEVGERCYTIRHNDERLVLDFR